MELQRGFSLYCEQFPEQKSDIKRICLALRRGGVNTMEHLMELYLNSPRSLSSIRDIGSARMSIIEGILSFYESASGAQPGHSAVFPVI